MGSTIGGQSVATDRWLRAAGMLLAWAAVAAALAGALQLHPAAGQSHSVIALVVTLCACAVLVAWALVPTSPPRARHVSPLYRVETEPPATVEPGTVSPPPTAAIARLAGSRFPLVAPPRPLYAADELVPPTSAGERASPFLDDALFRLEDPGPGARLLRVSKDVTQLCQDSFACDPERGVYAVTDGVSRSFMPAAWARIVAQAAVAHPQPFASEEEFAVWLDAAAEHWRAWMREVWLPQIQAFSSASHQSGEWSAAIDGQGAQTTLVSCSISGWTRGVPRTDSARPSDGALARVTPPAEEGTVRVDVTAIGDSECLLYRQVAGRCELIASFPLEHPADFGASPATLSTRRDPLQVAASYRGLRRGSFDARSGDRLVLATDAVACWLLAQGQGSSVSSTASPVSSVVSRSATLSPHSVVAGPASPLPGGDDPFGGGPADESAPRGPRPQSPPARAGDRASATGASATLSARRERGSGVDDLITLLLDNPAGFERLAQVEIDAGRLEDDDLTLLVIVIP